MSLEHGCANFLSPERMVALQEEFDWLTCGAYQLRATTSSGGGRSCER